MRAQANDSMVELDDVKYGVMGAWVLILWMRVPAAGRPSASLHAGGMPDCLLELARRAHVLLVMAHSDVHSTSAMRHPRGLIWHSVHARAGQ